MPAQMTSSPLSKEYGVKLGLCFQIIDDILDVTGTVEATGKPVGGDLKSGLITAPALFVLEAGGAPAVALTQLIKDRRVQNEEGLEEALTIIRQNGGVEAALALAARIGGEAKASLGILPDSDSKSALAGLVDYVLIRNK